MSQTEYKTDSLCLPVVHKHVSYMSIINLKFEYLKNDACTTRKKINVRLCEFGIVVDKK